MSEEETARVDLLARYILALWQEVDELKRSVVELKKTQVAECEVIEMLADVFPDLHEPEEMPTPPLSGRYTPKPQRVPLSKRDPAIAERWRNLWSVS